MLIILLGSVLVYIYYLKEKKEELLNQAKNILKQLIEQANSVEAEISILSKKKLDKMYSQKLERVLSNVLRMRQAAEKKMQTAFVEEDKRIRPLLVEYR